MEIGKPVPFGRTSLAYGLGMTTCIRQVNACIMTPVGRDTDGKVFKALADPTRRYLLDRLYEENGQTLGELCERLQMARQSVTQHLEVLEAANLVITVRRGREKLHYLNAVPIHEIEERWINKFERPRLRALSAIKRRAEEAEMPDQPMPTNSPTNWQTNFCVRHLHSEHTRAGVARADRLRIKR